MTEINIYVKDITCSSCSLTIEKAILSNEKTNKYINKLAINPITKVLQINLAKAEQNHRVEFAINEYINEILSVLVSIGFEGEVLNLKQDFDSVENIANGKNSKEVSLSINGMTCSTCTSTVENVIQKFNEKHNDSVYQISVTLLPIGKVTVEYNPNRVAPADIVEAIENVGFEAKILSDNKVELLKNENFEAYFALNHEEENVQTQKPEEILAILISVKQSISKLIKEHQNNNITAVEILNNAELVIKYKISDNNNLVNGKRDLLKMVRGFNKNIIMVNKNSFGSLDMMEEKRTEEINDWKSELVFASIFTIPAFTISMVLGMIFPFGPIYEWLHSIFFLNILWIEFIMLLLATPVQFVSGRRFYKDFFYSVIVSHEVGGMSTLVCLSTSASYFYSVFAVVYNAFFLSANTGDPLILSYAYNSNQRLNSDNIHHTRFMQFFETSAMLITFVILGKYLEAIAKAKTSQALSYLASLAPPTARLLITNESDDNNAVLDKENQFQNQEVEIIDISLLQLNDFLKILPGDKIPTDCIVVKGQTSIDESMLTGESMPVTKRFGDTVYAGTINCDGSIIVKVNSLGDNTALSQIIKLVQDAQASKPPIQQFADKISSIFVPFVLIFSVFTFLVWIIIIKSGKFEETIKTWPYREQNMNDYVFAFLFSISVLVIACPCALGLATPTAVMVGTGVGAKLGILIKGGEALENCQKITSIVFDKTGTLTKGEPEVTDIVLLQFMSDVDLGDINNNIRLKQAKKDLMYLLGCAEAGSEHPLGKAIIKKANTYYKESPDTMKKVSSDTPIQFKNYPGMGISCVVSGDAQQKNQTTHVVIGNRNIVKALNIEIDDDINHQLEEKMKHLEKQGKTAIVICVDYKIYALLGIQDIPRHDAKLAVAVLQSMDINVYMLTGDNITTAHVIANELGIKISNVIAGVIPEEKANMIQDLKNRPGETVAMVGDGINDSPALACADVGISVKYGANVAIEASDMILMSNNLVDVITAIELSKVIYRKIKMNFAWALGYNTIGIPIAAGILYPLIHIALPPWLSGGAMALSSVSVVVSSLSLKYFKKPVIQKVAVDNDKYKSSRYRLKSLSTFFPSRYNNSTVDYENVDKVCKMLIGEECNCDENKCNCSSCTKHENSIGKESKIMRQDNLAFGMCSGCASRDGLPCNCSEAKYVNSANLSMPLLHSSNGCNCKEICKSRIIEDGISRNEKSLDMV